jgi:CheY-like chemotaxis protein
MKRRLETSTRVQLRGGIVTPRVLVVDNLRLVRRGMVKMLESLYEVTPASSGIEALRLIRAGKRYDVVVSDLSMPEMSGVDLYLKLLGEYPHQVERFVFSTARPDILFAMSDLLVTEIRLLAKPYSGDDLRAAIDGVLRAVPPRGDVQGSRA